MWWMKWRRKCCSQVSCMKVERVDVSRDGLPAYIYIYMLKCKHPSVGIAGSHPGSCFLSLHSHVRPCKVHFKLSIHFLVFVSVARRFWTSDVIKFWTDLYYIVCVWISSSFGIFYGTNLCYHVLKTSKFLKPVINIWTYV